MLYEVGELILKAREEMPTFFRMVSAYYAFRRMKVILFDIDLRNASKSKYKYLGK
ncbi:hypothetical protein O998_03305 [Anaplasma phagocytophilum str. Norway variant1]|uniref:Uncharacterized protein n=2 Tax=Anaplasma phagocytophilum TaxID=948 RepID=A0A7H9DZ22_ANAPH|nr:hypothetical protein APHMUC_0450 [Anaplasma phagocytophilum str. ApMUC09]QLL66812.1 hypothetical protein O998_03305 [Anaplasma phagocytophilum str. Norway variant1]SCV61707.1 hypothetical protein ANAPH2_00061 [Anaplasma phagocytophilum]SCV62151.1 hypothetical protein ANAPH1_00155 [Anaplasma phagocytophilum]